MYTFPYILLLVLFTVNNTYQVLMALSFAMDLQSLGLAGVRSAVYGKGSTKAILNLCEESLLLTAIAQYWSLLLIQMQQHYAHRLLSAIITSRRDGLLENSHWRRVNQRFSVLITTTPWLAMLMYLQACVLAGSFAAIDHSVYLASTGMPLGISAAALDHFDYVNLVGIYSSAASVIASKPKLSNNTQSSNDWTPNKDGVLMPTKANGLLFPVKYGRYDLRLQPGTHFGQWLTGFTEGDGTFTVTPRAATNGRSPGQYQFNYRITQSKYNYRILRFVQLHLSCGSITDHGDKDAYLFRVSHPDILRSHVLPIFDQSGMHSQKEHRYSMFRTALLSSSVKVREECKALLGEVPLEFKSSNPQTPSKSWIIGFMEAEGSFHIESNDQNKKMSYHYPKVSCNQKLDRHLLVQICDAVQMGGGSPTSVTALRITPTKTKVNNKFSLGKVSDLPFIFAYFANSMHGMKAVEFRLLQSVYNVTKDMPAVAKEPLLLHAKVKIHDLREFQKYLHILGTSCKLRPGTMFGKWKAGCNFYMPTQPGISSITEQKRPLRHPL